MRVSVIAGLTRECFQAPIYGADTSGTLFDEGVSWNLGELDTILDDLCRETGASLEGVTNPYLYFGMWKTTFAWHIEDMNLYSINYLHFGEAKRWYGVPPESAYRLEEYAKSHFADGFKSCPNFLRHKTTLISPKCLKDAGIPVVSGIQMPGHFIVTFPCGYHQGFNCGFNCAEAINFASEAWIDKAKHATPCRCISDAVSIDMSFFIRKFRPHELEEMTPPELLDDHILDEKELEEAWEREKERNVSAGQHVERRICAVCCEGGILSTEVSDSKDDACESQMMEMCSECSVHVHRRCYGIAPDAPRGVWKCDRCEEAPKFVKCMLCPNAGGAFKKVHDEDDEKESRWVHVQCALWMPEVFFGKPYCLSEVQGLELIGRDRWELVCAVCRKQRKTKARGACIQCSKNTCATAYHVTCAQQAGLHIRQRSALEGAETFCAVHDPVKGASGLENLTDGQLVCWGAHGLLEGKIRTITKEKFCHVTFNDDASSSRLIPDDCVKQDEEAVAKGEEHAVLVRWCDGKDYPAELESPYEVSSVELENNEGWYIGVLPAHTVFTDKPAAKKASRGAGESSRKRKGGDGTYGTRQTVNTMTPKTRNWTALLKSVAVLGEEVRCKDEVGILIWNADKEMTEVEYKINGTKKVGSLSQFEIAAGCRLKNAKVSVRLVKTGAALGQEAADQAMQDGTARVEGNQAAKKSKAESSRRTTRLWLQWCHCCRLVAGFRITGVL